MKFSYPWLALGLGLIIAVILVVSGAVDPASQPALPLLTLLIMTEFGFFVTAIGAVQAIRAGLAQGFGLALLTVIAGCSLLSIGFMWLGISLWPGGFPGHQLTEFNGLTMGTSWSVKVVDLPGTINQSTVDGVITKTLAAISRSMSTYDAESELSRFNSSSSTDWLTASDALVEVLGAANEVSKLTGGAFDITVGPLVNLWGFGPQGVRRETPDENEIESARTRTGYTNVEVRQTPAAIRKRLQGLYIDLSSIAKGYAVDRIAGLLEQQGIENYLVEIGGELRGKGHNERATSWRVGIERPSATDRTVYAAINIDGAGLATSGDYRNYFEQDGLRYSHTINPVTGRPVTHRLASVTVVTASAMRADALATALMVLGPEDGYALAEREGIAAFFIVRADDGFIDRASSAFTRYQAAQKVRGSASGESSKVLNPLSPTRSRVVDAPLASFINVMNNNKIKGTS